jgi:hypothetical protein
VTPAGTATGSGSFGTVLIGQTSAPVSLAFTFGGNATLGTPAALTEGATGLDFAIAGGGTCVPGASFSTGNTCTLKVTFTPKYAGLRQGAAVLNDAAGNAIALAYVHGTGSGPQVSYLPYNSTSLGGGFYNPVSIAVDGNGNVFIADYSNQISEIPPGCTSSSCVTAVGSGFNQAAGVAVDGAGNVFVADTYNSAVKEIMAASIRWRCYRLRSLRNWACNSPSECRCQCRAIPRD